MKYTVAQDRVVRTIPKAAIRYARTHRPELWPQIRKALADGLLVVVDGVHSGVLWKAGGQRGGKDIRRIPTGRTTKSGKPIYRYEYADDSHHKHASGGQERTKRKPQQLALFSTEQVPPPDAFKVAEAERAGRSSRQLPLTRRGFGPKPSMRPWSDENPTMRIVKLAASKVIGKLRGVFGIGDGGVKVTQHSPGRVVIDLNEVAPDRHEEAARHLLQANDGYEIEFPTQRRVREGSQPITPADLANGLFVVRRYERMPAGFLVNELAESLRDSKPKRASLFDYLAAIKETDDPKALEALHAAIMAHLDKPEAPKPAAEPVADAGSAGVSGAGGSLSIRDLLQAIASRLTELGVDPPEVPGGSKSEPGWDRMPENQKRALLAFVDGGHTQTDALRLESAGLIETSGIAKRLTPAGMAAMEAHYKEARGAQQGRKADAEPPPVAKVAPTGFEPRARPAEAQYTFGDWTHPKTEERRIYLRSRQIPRGVKVFAVRAETGGVHVKVVDRRKRAATPWTLADGARAVTAALKERFGHDSLTWDNLTAQVEHEDAKPEAAPAEPPARPETAEPEATPPVPTATAEPDISDVYEYGDKKYTVTKLSGKDAQLINAQGYRIRVPLEVLRVGDKWTKLGKVGSPAVTEPEIAEPVEEVEPVEPQQADPEPEAITSVLPEGGYHNPDKAQVAEARSQLRELVSGIKVRMRNRAMNITRSPNFRPSETVAILDWLQANGWIPIQADGRDPSPRMRQMAKDGHGLQTITAYRAGARIDPAPAPAPKADAVGAAAQLLDAAAASAHLKAAARVNDFANFSIVGYEWLKDRIVDRVATDGASSPWALLLEDHDAQTRILRHVHAANFKVESAKAADAAPSVPPHVVDRMSAEPEHVPEAEETPPEVPPAPEPDPEPETPRAKPEKARAGFAQKMTDGERKKANARALDLVEASLERDLTQAELEEVSKYSGEGGIGASLNQYFTRPDIARAAWDLLAHHGAGRRVLEPACGSGVFLETAPKDVKVTGVEIDGKVAGVARALHGGRHDVVHSAFEDFALQRAGVPEFDAVVTNAPFVARTGGGARRHKPGIRSADQYFIDTSLDQVKPGGLVAMIVHKGVMSSSRGDEFRQRMLARAELVDSFRLPQEAFAHAGTEVTTDLIILRKRDPKVAAALEAGGQKLMQEAGVWDQSLVDGSWYDNHRDRELGKRDTDWRESQILLGDPAKAAKQLTKLGTKAGPGGPAGKTLTLEELRAAVADNSELTEAIDRGLAKVPTGPPHIGATRMEQGIQYIYLGEPPLWHRIDDVDDIGAIIHKTSSEGVRQARDIARDIGDLVKAVDGGDYYKARHMRRDLQRRVRDWVEANGIPSEHSELRALAKKDRVLLDLLGAVHEDGSLSDLLHRDPPAVQPSGRVDTSDVHAVAAHIASTNEGWVSIDDVKALWRGSGSDSTIRDELLTSGAYALEDGRVRHMEDYLTGDLWSKLAVERDWLADGEEHTHDRTIRQRQHDALQALIDERWRALDDVELSLRSGWIPPDVLSDFISENQKAIFYFDSEARYEVTHDGTMYRMTKHYPPSKHHPEGRVAVDDGTDSDLTKILNRLRVTKDYRERFVEDIEPLFGEWLRRSPHRDRVEQLYNQTFFGERRREYSAGDLGLPGMSEDVELHGYQNQTCRHVAAEGKGIVALDVGLGKTFTAITLAHMMKAQGKARKPVVVVPKSVTTNWQAEVEKIQPGAKVLVIGETRKQYTTGRKKGQWYSVADTPEERNRKLALAKQNDYDLIVITKPAFQRIPLKPDTVEKFEGDDFWMKRARAVDNATGSATTETYQKRIEKLKASYEAEQAGLDYEHAKDMVYWEDLGVDFLMADEAHSYKNLNAARSRWGKSPKFLGGSAVSKQAKDMKHKARVVRERTGGKGIVFLTATPTKNSPLEIYNMLEHIAPEEFEARGIRNAEEFIDRFCVMEERQVLNSKGAISTELCVTGFKNLSEIQGLMDRYMQVKTAEDVGLRIPKADEHIELVEMDDAQKAVYAELRAEAELDDQEPGHLFRVLDKMKKAAQDLELYDPKQFEGYAKRSPKYKRAVQKIVEGAKEGGQIVFVDHNAIHTTVRDMLIDAGFKPSEIAIINAKTAKDSQKRYEIGEKFNRGEVKVVIGNTGTMGEGVNLQKRTTDIHHLDQPWDPGSMQQRNGRGVRQGNPNEKVRVHTYLAKGSFDGFRHGTLEGKRGWLAKLRSGADSIANEEAQSDFSREELMIMLAEDPDAAREEFAAARESANEAWRMKQAAVSVKEFTRYKSMQANLAALPAEGKSAQVLRGKLERLARKLKADPHLPAQAKPLLDKPDAALVDPSGVVVTKGAVLLANDADYRGKRQRFIVESVDYRTQKVAIRQWGVDYRPRGTGLDEVVSGYSVTEQTAADEFNEGLDAIRDPDDTERRAWASDYQGPFSKHLKAIREDTLKAHANEIRDALRTNMAARVGAEGRYTTTIVARDTHGKVAELKPEQVAADPNLHVLLPFDDHDFEELVTAAVAANTSSYRWAGEYGNAVLNGINRSFGETWRKKVATEAQRRWQAAKDAA